MIESGAAFLSVLSTVSGQVALAGGIQGLLGPQQELCTLHTVISPAEYPGSPRKRPFWQVGVESPPLPRQTVCSV